MYTYIYCTYYLLSKYISHIKKLNITFYFRCHMYDNSFKAWCHTICTPCSSSSCSILSHLLRLSLPGTRLMDNPRAQLHSCNVWQNDKRNAYNIIKFWTIRLVGSSVLDDTGALEWLRTESREDKVENWTKYDGTAWNIAKDWHFLYIVRYLGSA